MGNNKANCILPQYLIEEFLYKIKVLKNSSMKDIYEEISKYTELSVQTVRKYKDETNKYKAELLLLGCIELGLNSDVDSKELDEFAKKYVESFEKNYNYEVNIKKYAQTRKELEYCRKESEPDRIIVCPQVLADRLDSFLQKSNKRFLYLAGTYKSGCTVSVLKYFEEKSGEKKPLIFDFYNKTIKEIRNNPALKIALWKNECVIIHIGLATYDFSEVNFWGNGKIILVAHTPCKNLYLKDMEYVIFNDLVNQEKCAEELLKKYVPELLELSKKYKVEKLFVTKIKEKTGGIPLAIYRLGHNIYEKELLKYEGNIKEFFDKHLYSIPELEQIYEQMWEEFIVPIWNIINENTKMLVICVSYFKGDISIDLLKFLLGDDLPDKEWRQAFSQAYQYMFLMESGRNQEDGENGIFRGVRFFPLIKELIQFKFWNDSNYNKYMEKGTEFYVKKLRELDVDALYSGEKTFLDRGGELAVVKEILRFCRIRNLNARYLLIAGNNMADFFYMKTKYLDMADQVNEERRYIAQKLGNHIQVMETYGMSMRRAARWNKKECALDTLKFAEEYRKGHPSIDIYKCNRFLNGKAVVLFKVKRDLEGAQRIWKDMLIKCSLGDRERSWCRRWEKKCDFLLKKESLHKLTEEFQSGYVSAIKKRYYRAATDYMLYKARCSLLLYVQELDKGYIELMKDSLQVIDNLIKDHAFLDDQYRADYYWLNSCALALEGNKEAADKEMNDAFNIASKINEISKHSIMKKLVNDLCKKGISSEKKGNIYENIVKCC